MKRFFTFEGIDGSGKTTVLDVVFNKLKKDQYPVIRTLEPTDSEIGRYVTDCIKTGKDPVVTAFTFISDRILHGKQITKWLDEGNIVLCDRYDDSTYAYQGAQLQDTIDTPIKWLQDLSKKRFPLPDRTYLFSISPEDAIRRIQDRDELIAFEKISFLEKVHKNYQFLSKGDRYKILDATHSIETIAQQIFDDITC
jgi:dTMP kinase